MDWIKKLSFYVYAIDIQKIILIISISIFSWGTISVLFFRRIRMQKLWQGINIVFFVMSLESILMLTMLMRNTMQEREVCLILCYTLYLALRSTEMYRTMVMNVFLFVPYGIFMPYILQKNSKKIITTILSALIFSFVIEGVQYIFTLGRAEVDDILCNTFGAAVGSLSYWLSSRIEKRKIKKRHL